MRRAVLAATLLAASPALAVGLGPLRKEGLTDGPDKAFYLTLYNPYDVRAVFAVHAVGADDEVAATRVRVPAQPLPLSAEATRRFMVIAGGLVPGESYTFRVCAERVVAEEEPVHARVCSRITARRLAAGG